MGVSINWVHLSFYQFEAGRTKRYEKEEVTSYVSLSLIPIFSCILFHTLHLNHLVSIILFFYLSAKTFSFSLIFYYPISMSILRILIISVRLFLYFLLSLSLSLSLSTSLLIFFFRRKFNLNFKSTVTPLLTNNLLLLVKSSRTTCNIQS